MPDTSKSTCHVDALCRTAEGAFAVAVENLTPDGCELVAPTAWTEDFEFLRLNLAGRADINGRVVRHEGRKAEIRFFGQIHPRAIEGLARAAA